jgi:FKBP-type peptidyl-prolyl cis-trans isomerase FkpA
MQFNKIKVLPPARRRKSLVQGTYLCPLLMKHMKRQIGILLLPVLLMGCFKPDENNCVPQEVTTMAPASEVNGLKNYLTANGISTTEDPRGFFYTIDPLGTGAKPNSCSFVGLDYVAKLLNGTTVDSNNNVTYAVSDFIIGWQEALPLLPVGSKMTLYLPPSLAYGSTANGNVPANSNMIFHINLRSASN